MAGALLLPSTASKAVTLPGCSARSAAALIQLPVRGRLAGDVDGDGRSDQVGLAVDRSATPSCRYVLWVRIRGHVAAHVVRQRESSEQYFPFLAELARVARGRGAQPVVDFGGGAGVDSYGLYDLVGGKLVRMGVLPPLPKLGNTFQSGGTNAGGEGTICARGPGKGIVLVAGYTVVQAERNQLPTQGGLYVQRGTVFVPVGPDRPLTTVEKRNWRQVSSGGRHASIFRNCAIAAVPR